MHARQVLLLTDLVDSTRLAERLGDVAAAALWEAHDRMARDLLRQFNGRELDRSDGYLWLFDSVPDAVAHVLAYHHALRSFDPPLFARAGLHSGPLVMRPNSLADVALGAKPVEFEGLAKSTAGRIMSLALGGQTLISAEARAQLAGGPWRVVSHGHWRLKGLVEPVELFETGADDAPFRPPPDTTKAYRVTRTTGGWTPTRELPHNLPAERDPFFGRRQDLQDLARRIDDGARLVSLLGIGGIGKTRLALRYARLWMGDFAGGAWFCDLSAARDTEGIAHAVALALDVPLGKADPVQQLGTAIAGHGRCLVVLDNFEQVARLAEATLGAWLDRAPEAGFVVTSREVLGIAGEQAMVLAPLAPDAAQAMFVQRMRANGTGGLASEADRAAIAPLIELLDRLPLAIEFAAARASVMSPRTLLQRMGDRFKLLSGRGGRQDRQATLRATLDWSWDLLSGAEKSALAQLSVFEGGFTLALAEGVLDLSDCEGDTWVVDAVQSLVQKSLVRTVGDERFDLLRSVQDFAAEQLDGMCRPRQEEPYTSRASLARQRHWAWFGAWDEAAARDCAAELPNIISACRRAALAGDGRGAVRNLVAAWSGIKLAGPFSTAMALIEGVRACHALDPSSVSRLDWIHGRALHAMGRLKESRSRFDAALGCKSAAGDGRLVARILLASGEQRISAGENDQARTELQHSRNLAAACGEARLECSAINALGVDAANHGRPSDARQHYEQALFLARKVCDQHLQGGVLGNLGELLQNSGHLEEAAVCYDSALHLVAEVGDRRWEGNIRCNHGLLMLQMRQTNAARLQFESALRIAREIGHTRLETMVLCNLGIAQREAGLLDLAQASLEAALAMASAAGDTHSAGQIHTYLGAALADGGQVALAQIQFELAGAKLRQVDDPMALAVLLAEDALLCCRQGDAARAQALCREVESLFASLHMTEDAELGRTLVKLRRALARAPADV